MGDVRGACSGAAMCRTKHRDRQAHHGAVVDSFVCRKLIVALRVRASPPMPAHHDQRPPGLDQVEHLIHSSGNPYANSRCRMNRSQTPLGDSWPWRGACSWWGGFPDLGELVVLERLRPCCLSLRSVPVSWVNATHRKQALDQFDQCEWISVGLAAGN